MWRKVLTERVVRQPWSMMSSWCSSTTATNISTAVNSILLRSLKDHYLEVSKTNPLPLSSSLCTIPPLFLNPPPAFTVVKGDLDGNGLVLSRAYGNEEISISVMQSANIVRGSIGEDEDANDINQVFFRVDVSKPGLEHSLHFLCGHYPDALGIHSVTMVPKLYSLGIFEVPSTYNGPAFEDLGERMRDAFHGFIEERGVNEKLLNFLQAWLYVKENWNLFHWFKTVGTFVNKNNSVKSA